jgi:signal transduction histidine kinase/DNA-binding response OmpR family regulator
MAVWVLLISIPVIILIVVPSIIQADLARQQRLQDMQVVVDAQAAQLSRWADDARTLLGENLSPAHAEVSAAVTELVLGSEAGSGAQRYAEARQVFSSGVFGLNDPFDYLVVTDASGVVRGSTLPQLLNRDMSLEPWFTSLSASPTPGQVVATGPLRDPFDGQQSLFFSVPVVGPAGTYSGVLAGRVDVLVLQEVLVSTPIWAQTADYYLVREGQQLVVPPLLDPSQTVATDEIVAQALARNDGSGEWQDYRGERVLGAYRWIGDLNMALVGKMDLAEALIGSQQIILVQIVLGIVAGLVSLVVAAFLVFQVSGQLGLVTNLAWRISRGAGGLRLPPSRFEEINGFSRAFNEVSDRLEHLAASQEEVVKARTRELEITARMGHVIASETELEPLLQTTIELVRDQLGYYHVQVFLLDDLRQNAVLRASMGDAGREMLARGHKLAVGSRSVVGQAAGRNEPVLASDTRYADYWYPNPLLPDTRAELAVPLRVGAQIIGVLDIQSAEPEVFDDTTISVLQTLTDQLAVAIRNAELFEEREGLLNASVELTQMLTQESWSDYVSRRRSVESGYRYDLTQVQPITDGLQRGDSDLRLPIELRGAVIGELNAELGSRHLTDNEQQLVSQVLNRVALAIDNARLVEQTQLSLVETNRLYLATQSIAAAGSIKDLSMLLATLAADSPTVDRAFVILLENPGQMTGTRWAYVAGSWLRNERDALGMLPDRLQVGQHPVLALVDQAQEEQLVIQDVDTAGIDPVTRNEMVSLGARAVAVFPIISPTAGRQVLGWLMMHGVQQTNIFHEEDIRFFSTVSSQAATAFEGLRLFEQTQIRARRLQATNEVSRAASSILNPDVLLPLIVERISEAFGYYHTQIFLTDKAFEWAVLRASTGKVGQMLLERGHKLAVGSRSVIGQVTARGEMVIARDTDIDAVHRRNELLPDTRAEMALPLRAGDRVIGTLDVQSTQVDAFDTEAQAILQSLADQVAVTLENAQLFQEIQERVGELTMVNLVSQAVSRAQTLEEVYDVVADQLVGQLFGVRYAYLGVLDADQMLHLPVFIENGVRVPSPAPQPVGQGISGHVLRTGQVLMINESTEEQARALGARQLGAMPKSLLAVPMLLGDEAIGVISIQDADHENAFDEADVRQLTTLATYIAVKVRNVELLEEAQRRADELSFLFEVTRTAVASTNLDEALAGVAEVLLHKIVHAESATIYLAEGDGKTYTARAAAGYGRDVVARHHAVSAGEGAVGLAAEQRKPLLVNDAQQEAFARNGHSQTRSALVVPLVSGHEVVGVMSVESAQPGIFDDAGLRLLEGASSTLTAVIQSARLLEQITRANEQLRELDRLKQQFLANMSHELRTPLNSIIGFSRVMLKGIDGELNDLQTQDLTTIYNSGQHLLGLINNLLDLSRLEARKMEIQPEYFALKEIVDAVVATGRGLVKDRPIEMLVEMEENLPKVYADPVRVRQVLLNLVSNASKFTKEGSITVRLTRQSFNPQTKEPPRVQIDVIDTGIGIADEDMDKLFEPFSQVDGSTTRQVGGTGLGLTISRELVEMMGGCITVTSTVGVGSTFGFTVPLHPPEAESSEVVHTSEDLEGRPLVLAVDDEPGVLDLYARYLEKQGYAVIGLSNANDLLGHVRKSHPAAILLDLNLPGKTGWDAIADLRQTEDTRDIPIVICSIDDDRERGRQAGVSDYLVKPVIEDDLVAAVERVTGPVSALRHVMLVDPDEDFSAAVAQSLVDVCGCQLQWYGTGLDILQAIQEDRPDLLVIEIDLPDMDGFGLLMSLRSQPEFEKLPVVVLTGRSLDPEDLERLGTGVTRYLHKPAAGEALVENLSAALSDMGR